MAIPVTFVGDKYAKQSTSNPREIPQAQFKTYQPLNTSSSVRINNFIWINTPIQSGRVFLSSQGKRLVLEATQSRIIYILVDKGSKDNNKIYIQQTKGFIGDVTMYPFEKAGKDLQFVKKIAEYEVQLIIGIYSVTSWAAFALVMGVDVLAFTVKNKDNFSKWSKIIQGCLKTREDLKKYAPTLYEKLVYSALLVAWEGTKYAGSKKGDVANSIAEAALNDPKIAGRGAGIIVGKIGVNALNGRISVLSVIWTLLFTVASKAATAIPGAIKATIDDIKTSSLKEKAVIAEEIISLLQRTDIKLSKEEAIIIVGEVMDHPKELIDSLSSLSKIFKENMVK